MLRTCISHHYYNVASLNSQKGIWQVRVFVTVYVSFPKACPRSVWQCLDRIHIIQLLVLVIWKQLDPSYHEQGKGNAKLEIPFTFPGCDFESTLFESLTSGFKGGTASLLAYVCLEPSSQCVTANACHDLSFMSAYVLWLHCLFE